MAIAGDARIAWQTAKLLELEAQIKTEPGGLGGEESAACGMAAKAR